MPTSNAELADFVEFATARLQRQERASLEELIIQWREQGNHAATVADIRQGLSDHAASRGQPLQEAFADIRRQLERRG